MINKIRQYDWKKYNYSLLVVVIMLCLIGAYVVKLAGGDEYGLRYMRSQLIGLILGLIIVAGMSLFDYRFLCKFTIIYYFAGMVLTAATHSSIGADNDTGVYRWIRVAGITFQPSELMKIILILTLATFFVKFRRRMDRISTFIIACALAVVPVLLIMSQPDLSSSLVAVFILIVMVFVSGLSYRILVPIFLASIPAIAVLFWYIQQPGNLLLQNYQYDRIMAWRFPELDVDGKINYQQNRSMRAIAAGQLYGKLLQDGGEDGASRAYRVVSVNESDFIWSVISEEFGFLGCCLILLLFAFVIYKCLMVAKKAQDYLGKLIAVGVSAMFMFQIFANICVVTFIFPNTGLPLPFLSSGLSSLVSSMMGIGLIMNISIQPAKSSRGGFSMRNLYGNDPTSEVDIDF